MQIGLRLSTVDPYIGKEKCIGRIHITNHGGGGVASVES